MNRHVSILATVLVVVLLAVDARSASVTLTASKDNSIFQNFGENSAGGAAGIFTGTTGTGSPRRGLIAFDVAASVPAGATITSAELILNLALSGGGANQTIRLHRLLADWGEGAAGSDTVSVHFSGQGFSAAPGDATWNQRFFGSHSWSNPGAEGDYAPTASTSAVVGVADLNPTPYQWPSSAALVSDVQHWLDNPAANFGWIMISADETSRGTARAFFSRSATVNAGGDPLDLGARPALSITYTADIPEPHAVWLTLVGVMLLNGGQRRRYRSSIGTCGESATP